MLSDTSPATPGPTPPQPRRSGHGCLWGCLIALAIAIAAVIGAMSYFGWFFASGFKDSPTLRMVMEVVNGDETARAILGDNIEITSLESSSFADDTIVGKRESYVARVKGGRAEGTLSVTVDSHAALKHITSLVLTGPDGRTYDLTSSQSRAPPGSI